jgi:crotonobetainyl-CoA:carnitine CoA-transferase CaiB-like acyl-CoA transferase
MDSYAGPEYEGVPAIGEHTASALRELLGTTAQDLDALGNSGVVAVPQTADGAR